jgi:hypothetical protein
MPALALETRITVVKNKVISDFISFFPFLKLDIKFIRPNTSRPHCTVSLSHYTKRFKAKYIELTHKTCSPDDKVGRKTVIWISILGAAPFTLLFPYCNLFWTAALSVFIGLILSSAFSAVVVLAQELVPNKIGMISGVFFGLMFGISGIAAAGLGAIGDATSIEHIFDLCAYLPLLGIITILLPRMKRD